MGTSLKAEYLLIHNIKALLADRNVDAAALAFAIGHSQAWISKILSGDRKMKLSDIDAVADFFGLTVSQLLSHGISSFTERRKRDRRSGDERRSGLDHRRARPQHTSGPFRMREFPSRPRKPGDEPDAVQ